MAHIQKRGDNSYRIIVSNGYDIKGKKIPAMKTVRLDPTLSPKKKESELSRLSAEFEQEVKNGLFLDGSKITFAEFSERWMKDYAEQELELKTIKRYREMLDSRILPAMGHLKIAKVHPTHLIAFYKNLREPGVRLDEKYVANENFIELLKTKGLSNYKLAQMANISDKTISKARKGQNVAKESANKLCDILKVKLKEYFTKAETARTLSDRTVKHHHELIGSIFSDAVEWQIIESSPAERVASPKVEKRIPNHYNKQQSLDLIEALSSEPIEYRAMVLLDAFTGLRIGEFMGIDWSDIDFEVNTITISKASQYIPGEGTFTKDKPKNNHSVRMISFSPFIEALLKDYKEWWEKKKSSCGDLWKGSDRLFVTWDGQPRFTYTLTNWMPDFLERHGLPKLTPHGIRHTFASLLAKKLPIPELAKLLGHGRPSTTSDIYTHFLQDGNSEAANILEAMLITKPCTEKHKKR